MAIYKRGGKYWFEFVFEGRRIRRSTKTRSRKAARDIESAYRVKLANVEVGLEEPKRAKSEQDRQNHEIIAEEHPDCGISVSTKQWAVRKHHNLSAKYSVDSDLRLL